MKLFSFFHWHKTPGFPGRFAWQNNNAEERYQAEIASQKKDSPEQKIAEDEFYREMAQLALESSPGAKEKAIGAFSTEFSFDGRSLSIQLAEKFGEKYDQGWGFDKQPQTFYLLGALQGLYKNHGLRVDRASNFKGKTLKLVDRNFVLESKDGTQINIESQTVNTAPGAEAGQKKSAENLQDNQKQGETKSRLEKEIIRIKGTHKPLQAGNIIDPKEKIISWEQELEKLEKDERYWDLKEFQVLQSKVLRARNKYTLAIAARTAINGRSLDWDDEGVFEQDGERIKVDIDASWYQVNKWGSWGDEYLFEEDDYKIPGNFKIEEALEILKNPSNKKYLEDGNEKVLKEVGIEEDEKPEDAKSLEFEEAVEEAISHLTERGQAFDVLDKFSDNGQDFEDQPELSGDFPNSLAYGPFLLEMMKDFDDVDLWGYEREEGLAKQAVEKTAENLKNLKNSRDSIGKTLQEIVISVVENNPDATEEDLEDLLNGVPDFQELNTLYEELDDAYRQDIQILAEVSGNIGGNERWTWTRFTKEEMDFYENSDFRNSEVAADFARETIESMESFEEAFDWVNRSLKRIEDNGGKSSGLEETYEMFVNNCKDALTQKAQQDPENTAKNYVLLVKLFTDRLESGNNVDGFLEDPDFAIDRLEEVLDINRLAENYFKEQGETLPLRKETADRRNKVKEKISKLGLKPTEQELSVLDLNPEDCQNVPLEKLSTQYALVRAWEIAIENKENGTNKKISEAKIQDEFNGQALAHFRKAREKFSDFLATGLSDYNGRDASEIKEHTGGIELDENQIAALELLNDIQGNGWWEASDSFKAGAVEVAKITAVVAAGIAVGVLTAGAGFVAAAAISGVTMTAANAAIYQRGFDDWQEGVAIYGTDLLVNTATMGLARYTSALGQVARLRFMSGSGGRAALRQMSGGSKNIFRTAGKMSTGGKWSIGRPGPNNFQGINQLDDSFNLGARLGGYGIEATADFAISQPLEAWRLSVQRGGSFWENLDLLVKDPTTIAMMAGFGVAFHGGPALRKLYKSQPSEVAGLSASMKKYMNARNDLIRSNKDLTHKSLDEYLSGAKEIPKNLQRQIKELQNSGQELAENWNRAVNGQVKIESATAKNFYQKNKNKELTQRDLNTIEKNSKLSDSNRIEAAEKILKRDLDETEKSALLDAHEVPKGNNVVKGKILRAAGFSEAEAFMIMRKGLAGKDLVTEWKELQAKLKSAKKVHEDAEAAYFAELNGSKDAKKLENLQKDMETKKGSYDDLQREYDTFKSNNPDDIENFEKGIFNKQKQSGPKKEAKTGAAAEKRRQAKEYVVFYEKNKKDIEKIANATSMTDMLGTNKSKWKAEYKRLAGIFYSDRLPNGFSDEFMKKINAAKDNIDTPHNFKERKINLTETKRLYNQAKKNPGKFGETPKNPPKPKFDREAGGYHSSGKKKVVKEPGFWDKVFGRKTSSLSNEVIRNYQITDIHKRVKVAAQKLGRKLKPKEQKAIKKAHLIGWETVELPDGTIVPGTLKQKLSKMSMKQRKEFWKKIKSGKEKLYTREQLRAKVTLLAEAGFKQPEREKLIRSGITGFGADMRVVAGKFSRIYQNIHGEITSRGPVILPGGFRNWRNYLPPTPVRLAYRLVTSPTVYMAPIRLLTAIPLRGTARLLGRNSLWGLGSGLRRLHNLMSPENWTSMRTNWFGRLRENWRRTRVNRNKSWYDNSILNKRNWESNPWGRYQIDTRINHGNRAKYLILSRYLGKSKRDLITQLDASGNDDVESLLRKIEKRIKKTETLQKRYKKLNKKTPNTDLQNRLLKLEVLRKQLEEIKQAKVSDAKWQAFKQAEMDSVQKYVNETKLPNTQQSVGQIDLEINNAITARHGGQPLLRRLDSRLDTIRGDLVLLHTDSYLTSSQKSEINSLIRTIDDLKANIAAAMPGATP